jgi:hypothetical protein
MNAQFHDIHTIVAQVFGTNVSAARLENQFFQRG